MKKYYYVHTGHRIGLDRFRRAVVILNELDDDITLLCSDFRIAQVAKDFGVQDSVGIDVVRNIPYIAENGDLLIFDSDEANPIMLEDMKNFFSTFIHVAENEVVVDKKYFKNFEKTTKISYFFGDDDYEKDLIKHTDFIDGLDVALGLGFYYFLDYEDELRERFSKCFEFEEYDEMVTTSEILVTSSPQAVLDSLASGGKPVYFQREDYTQSFNEIFEKLNVPIIYNYNKVKLEEIIGNILDIKYVKITQNSNKIVKLINNNLNL